MGSCLSPMLGFLVRVVPLPISFVVLSVGRAFCQFALLFHIVPDILPASLDRHSSQLLSLSHVLPILSHSLTSLLLQSILPL